MLCREHEKIDIVELKGSYYEVGLAHGRMLHNSNHYQSMLSGIRGNLNLAQKMKISLYGIMKMIADVSLRLR